MKETGNTIFRMDRVPRPGSMVADTKANTKMVSSMEWVTTCGQTRVNTEETGRTMLYRVEATILGLMAEAIPVIG